MLFHYDVFHVAVARSIMSSPLFLCFDLPQKTVPCLDRESSDRAGVLDINHPHSVRGSAVLSVSSVPVPVIREVRLGARGSD